MPIEQGGERGNYGRSGDVVFQPRNPQDRNVVREHLEQVLSSSVFCHSKRYASVLRFMVERGLDATEPPLKERVIGAEVFGRAPDYDTSTDHVVRSAAAEIRKRLAQYYQESGSRTALRIDLQRGTYVPQFRMAVEEEPYSRPAVEPARNPESEAASPKSRWEFGRGYLASAAAFLLAVGVAAALVVRSDDTPLHRFWAPVLASDKTILLCVGTLGGGRGTGLPPEPNPQMSLSDFHSYDYEAVHMDDAETLARLAGLMAAKGKSYQIESQSQATYADLQREPAVLIGLMNNDWTERAVLDQRFSVVRPSPWVLMIRDRSHPTDTRWSVNYSTPYLDMTKDYAIVVRSLDPKTGQMVVTIAGLSVFGTMAAGRFVTDPEALKELDAVAPRGWEHKNIELLLSVDVIRGVPGRPVIQASHFW